MSAPRIAITGATGLIGAALVRSLPAAGFRILALARRPSAIPAAPAVETARYDFERPPDPALLRGCDALIHAAWDTRPRRPAAAHRASADASLRLLNASRAAGVQRFIFISSMSAHDASRSAYGRAKRTVEAALDPARDLAVRPGLVLARHAGLFGRIATVIARTGLAPRLGDGRQPIQTIHIDDLVEGVRLALRSPITGTLTLAEPDAIPLSDLFGMVGRALGRRVWFIPLPFAPLLAGLRAAEIIRLPLPITSDTLLGLAGLTAVDCRADLARLGLTVRPAHESLRALYGTLDPAACPATAESSRGTGLS